VDRFFCFLKKLFGWFLFAEAIGIILRTVAFHAVARPSEQIWGWNFVIAGHISCLVAALFFLGWYWLSIKE